MQFALSYLRQPMQRPAVHVSAIRKPHVNADCCNRAKPTWLKPITASNGPAETKVNYDLAV